MNFTTSDIASIIVAVIGLIGIIIQVIIAYKMGKDRVPENKTLSKIKDYKNSKPKKYVWIHIIIACVFAVMASPGVKTGYNKIFIEPSVRIIYPKENDRVEVSLNIKGKYHNVNPEKQTIWIAVYSQADNRYFLHETSATINRGEKEWTNVHTIVGTEYDKNTEADILALLIDYETNSYQEILNYLEDPARHGLERLPEGCQILSVVTVIIE